MPDHPIREVDGLVDGHLRPYRTLEAHYQINDRRHADKPQGYVTREKSSAAQGQQQIGDDDNYVDTQQRGSRYRADLGIHRDNGEYVVMRPVQRIQEEEKPEAQHRKEMAEDGPSG